MVAETLALLVLLVNIAAGDDASVAAALGPVHGCLYLLVIVVSVVERRSRRVTLLAALPAVGGLLAVTRLSRERAARRTPHQPDAAPLSGPAQEVPAPPPAP